MFYVYVLKSKKDGNLYIGSTNDFGVGMKNNVELRKKIEEELGDKFIPSFRDKPSGNTFQLIIT